MTRVIAGLNDDPGQAAPAAAPRGRRKGSALLSPAPSPGAPNAVLLAWITQTLRLPSRAVSISRWDGSSVSPLHIRLEDGRAVRFAEATDLADPRRLVLGVVLALQTSAPQLPVFSRADAQDLFTVAVRACAVTAADDAVARAQDWQDAAGRLLHEMHHGSYEDTAARWAALQWLRTQPDFDAAHHRLAQQDSRHAIPCLVWADGTKYVRVEDVARFVRGVLGEHLSPQQVRARMLEAGWQHTRAECRRPGAGRSRGDEDRVRVSVFVIACKSAETDVSPASPNKTAARTPAHASTAWGTLGTPAETPMGAENSEAGDTEEAGDTSNGPVRGFTVADWDDDHPDVVHLTGSVA